MSFPLYDTLIANLPKKDLTQREKEMVVRHIKKYDSTIHQRIYALIRCHQLQTSRDISLIPYEGLATRSEVRQFVSDDSLQTTDTLSDVSFDLEKLPIDLKQMILKFCKMNDQTTSQEK